MFGKKKKQILAEARWLRSVYRSCKTREQWDCANEVLRLWFYKWQRSIKSPEDIDLYEVVDLEEIGRIKNRLIDLGYKVGCYDVKFEIDGVKKLRQWQ